MSHKCDFNSLHEVQKNIRKGGGEEKDGLSSPAVAVKLGLTLRAVCEARNEAIETGELTTEDLWKGVNFDG